MPSAHLNGVELHYERTGAGEPVVVVHGSWADGRHWLRLAAELRDRFDVIAYDRRGHGRSGGRHEGVAADVSDLAALVEHAGAGPAHVVAGSFGASVALRLAVARPELLGSLSVHEPALPGLLGGAPRGGAPGGPVVDLLDSGDTEAAARRFAADSLGEAAWDGLSEDERDGFRDNGRAWRAEMADAEAFSIDPTALARFERPAMISTGTESPPFFRAIAAALEDALPHAETAAVEGAGHLPHLTHPREYARLVRELVSAAAAPR